MAETAEVPTREDDLEVVKEAISRDLPFRERVEARKALARLTAPPERDRYAVLAEARKALRAMEDEMDRGSGFGHGRAVEACSRADDAVFNALNVLANYLDDERAEAVLTDV